MHECLPALWRPCCVVGPLLGHTAPTQLLALCSRHRHLQHSRCACSCVPLMFLLSAAHPAGPSSPSHSRRKWAGGAPSSSTATAAWRARPAASQPAAARAGEAGCAQCMYFSLCYACLLGDAAVGGSHPMPSCSPDRLHGFGLRNLYLAFTALLAGREQCTCRCGAGWRSWRHPAA